MTVIHQHCCPNLESFFITVTVSPFSSHIDFPDHFGLCLHPSAGQCDGTVATQQLDGGWADQHRLKYSSSHPLIKKVKLFIKYQTMGERACWHCWHHWHYCAAGIISTLHCFTEGSLHTSSDPLIKAEAWRRRRAGTFSYFYKGHNGL